MEEDILHGPLSLARLYLLIFPLPPDKHPSVASHGESQTPRDPVVPHSPTSELCFVNLQGKLHIQATGKCPLTPNIRTLGWMGPVPLPGGSREPPMLTSVF